MGCEDFQVLLRSTADQGSVLRVLQHAGVEIDPGGGQLSTSVYLVHRDGRHVIELEVSHPKSWTSVSVRFALCHPDSVDNMFVDLVGKLAVALDATVRIMDEVEPGAGGNFDAHDLATFSATAKRAIAVRRAAWRVEFGSETAAIGCDEAIMRFVLRR
jgi:hypothetical protein